MTPQRWQQVDHMFHQAADLPTTERATWLQEACAGDAELHAEVAALLASDDEARGFLQQEVRGAIADFHSAAPPTRRAGPYRLVRELGRGGMGTVYLAERADDQYQGEVAIKLVRPGMDTDFFLARFRRERQALARLQHPNIARLLDSGATDDGLPYIVMERIDGQPINVYCRERQLDTDAVLRLFLPVCSAVAYAHRTFVVHRDIKPGNILVDSGGTPKLLDFGICKLLLREPAADVTLTGAAMMTPDYASPEQVRGDDINIASDIYSLGAVLYELLTGVRPHAIAKYTPRAVERAICEEDSAPPSAVVKDRALARRLSGDLDNILLKALQKESQRRYQSVEELAEDIRRYLDFQPVSARPDTITYRARKFARRNRGTLAAGVALAVALGAGVLVSLHEASVANRNFAQARKLASTLIFDVHDRVKDLPGSLAAREAIVRSGLGYLDAMSKTARGDADLRLELAAAYERMGMIQGNVFGSYTGDTTGAMASFQKGLSVLAGLSSSNPVDLERMVLLRRIGDLLRYTGHTQEGYQRFEDAVQIGEPLLQNDPHDYQVRKALAGVYDDYGSALREGTRVPKGLEIERKALDLLRGLLAEHPGDRSLRADLANSLAGIGSLYFNNNDLKTALQSFQQGAAEWDNLVHADPANVAYHRFRMLAYSHIGDVSGNPNYPNLGDQASAVAAYDVMLEEAHWLYQTSPSDQGATTDYGMALARTAVVPAELSAREALFRHSIEVLGRATARDARNTNIRVNLASIHEELADLLLSTGRAAEAVQEYHTALAMAEANLNAMVSSRRILITVSRQLGLDAARRSDAAAALNYGNRAVVVGDGGANMPHASLIARSLAPRAHAAMGDIYDALQNPAEARRWRQRSFQEFQILKSLPGFGGYIQDMMNRVEEQLKRK